LLRSSGRLAVIEDSTPARGIGSVRCRALLFAKKRVRKNAKKNGGDTALFFQIVCSFCRRAADFARTGCVRGLCGGASGDGGMLTAGADP
jgi:hypothetical protein